MTDYLLIQALNSLVIGIIYAVIAAGLTVIFSILKIVNFAHGEVYMMGGYFAYFAIALAGVPPGITNERSCASVALTSSQAPSSQAV